MEKYCGGPYGLPHIFSFESMELTLASLQMRRYQI